MADFFSKQSVIDPTITINVYTVGGLGYHLSQFGRVDSPLELISDPIKRLGVMAEAKALATLHFRTGPQI
jgi:hypothetical protein